ncbi:MAG: MBL fold metallo-hydrolase [Bacillota bacterium]
MSMLVHIKGNTYYIPGAVNIGVIKNEKNPEKSIIIDSGLDDDSGRKILKLLNDNGMSVGSIINTHSHADHCGGNSFIKSRTDASIYAGSLEKAIIEHPELEPFYLFSAAPMKELDVKFLKAKPSAVSHILEPGSLKIDDIELSVISLQGHTPGMMGIASTDGVFFVGDAVFSEDIINKYGLVYLYDVKSALSTLEYMKSMKYDYYIPCHGELVDNISDLVEANIKAVNDVEKEVLKFCTIPADRDRIVSRIIEKYKIKLTVPQYYLTVASVSAYLSFMTDSGMLKMSFEDNKLKWQRIID